MAAMGAALPFLEDTPRAEWDTKSDAPGLGTDFLPIYHQHQAKAESRSAVGLPEGEAPRAPGTPCVKVPAPAPDGPVRTGVFDHRVGSVVNPVGVFSE